MRLFSAIRPAFYPIAIAIIAAAILLSSVPAIAETAVLSGTMQSGADVTNTVTIDVENMAATQPGAQLTYNAPVPVSSGVSGYSESVSNVHLSVSPAPNGVTDTTDQFGNPYRQYTWNVGSANGSSYHITVTTTFHADITGDATPANYNDALGTGAMSQFLGSTRLVQANDASIKAKASQLVSGATGEADAVNRIMNFVETNMPNYDSNPAQKDAVWSLTSSSGDCVNRANLALALMRSQGIPCRYVSGYVYGNGFTVSYNSAQATISWAAGPHTWVEVYYPNEGVWVPYDPIREKGFTDSRHVKMQVSLDDDTGGDNYRSTHGDSGLFNIINMDQIPTVSISTGISVSGLNDNNHLKQYGNVLSDPAGSEILARSLLNTATATPTATATATITATPTSTATPTVTATVTVSPSASASATPTPVANATATPAASITATVPAGSGSEVYDFAYNITGDVVDTATQKPVSGATISYGNGTLRALDNGTFILSEPNGTYVLSVSADGYQPYNHTLQVSGQDQTLHVDLAPLPVSTAKPVAKSAFSIPGPAGITTIAIFLGGAALLWRTREQ